MGGTRHTIPWVGGSQTLTDTHTQLLYTDHFRFVSLRSETNKRFFASFHFTRHRLEKLKDDLKGSVSRELTGVQNGINRKVFLWRCVGRVIVNMPLLNQFGPFSDSWHVAVNSDIKHTMHSIGVHEVVVQR
jgi:hypothetical protein